VTRPTSSRLRRRGAAAAAAALLVGLALTACTPTKAGSAAIVGDASLSEATLTSLANEVRDVATTAEIEVPQADALNQRIVSVWVDEQLTAALADRVQAEATAAQVDSLLGQFQSDQLAQIQVGSGIAPSMLRDAAEAAVLRQAIVNAIAPGVGQQQQSALLGKAYLLVADQVGVSVNPRFGTWNAETAQVDASADDLSRPAEVPAVPGGVPVVPQQ
jgi:hypothetical protein